MNVDDTEPTSAVEQAVQARIAAARRREAEKQQQRAELAAARTAGVAKRHAQKLYRQAQHSEENPVPAALRSVCCPACRCERLARLMTTVTVGGTPYDVLRCAAQECELLWCVRANRPRTVPAAA